MSASLLTKTTLAAALATAATLATATFAAGAAAPTVNRKPETVNRGGSAAAPNILFIISDQINADMIQALSHNPYISTPNLDRLVNRGLAYTNTYSANPVCMPSRFAMFTGASTAENGIRTNIQGTREKIVPLITTRSMGVLFRNNGYETYYAGKTHLAYGASRNGKAGSTGGNADNLDNYGFKLLDHDMRDHLADTGAQFLTEHKSENNKPFLLCLSFINPHDICTESSDFLKAAGENPNLASRKHALYAPAKLKEILDCLATVHVQADKQPPAFWNSDDSAKLPLNMSPAKDNAAALRRSKAGGTPTQPQWRRYLWVYHRLVEVVDREIGVVLDALDKSPYKDNTIIIFTADHGEMGGSHGLTGKSILYEECQRVPFVFCGPNIRHGTDNTIVCNGWDLMPTLCDIATIPAPKQLTGISLYPNLTKNTPVPPRKYLYLESLPGLQIIADARYKYSLYDNQNPQYEMLYDLQTDPGEQRNLIADPKYKPLAADLRAQLKKEAAARNINLSPKKGAAAGKAKTKSKSAPQPAPSDDDE